MTLIGKKKVLLLLAIVLLLCAMLFACKSGEHTISFVTNGGGQIESIVTTGKTALYLPEPTREDYVFEGWYFDNGVWKERLTGTTYEKSRLKNDVTVYAKWKYVGEGTEEPQPGDYNVTFEENGGTEVEDFTVARGGSITNMPSTTRDGYTFLGWCYDETLACSFEYGKALTGSLTFYAKWLAIDPADDPSTQIIGFVSNGGNTISTKTIAHGDRLAMVYSYRLGYRLEGWYVDKDFNYEYSFSNVVVTSFVLYAKWSAAENCTVTYVTNGGTAVAPQSVPYGSRLFAPETTLAGMEIEGWYVDENFYSQFIFETQLVVSDITLYAEWRDIVEEKTYFFVNYELNGGQGVLPSLKLEKGSVVPSDAPIKDAHRFLGWCTDESLNTFYDFNIKLSHTINLYAKWELIPVYAEGGYSFEISDDDTYFIITGYTGELLALNLPESYQEKPVREVASRAFFGSAATSMTIPASITKIGKSAFAESAITLVELPATVLSVGDGAFENCLSLVSANILGNMECGASLFRGCTALRYVNAANTLEIISASMFSGCVKLPAFNMPSGLKRIESDAFYECVLLNNVILPDGCVYIGGRAFSKCNALQSISLGGAETIYSSAFAKSGVTNVVLPTSVETIAAEAFQGCWRLESVTIGSGVTAIGADSFVECIGLSSFMVEDSNTAYKTIDGNLYTVANELVAYCAAKLSARFAIPEGTVAILDYAFSGCDNLAALDIPVSLERVGVLSLNEPTNLQSFFVEEENTHFSAIDGNLYNADGTELIRYANANPNVSFTVAESVTSIGMCAFSGLKYLKTLTLGSQITALQPGTFFNSAIEEIVATANLVTISEHAFQGSEALNKITLPSLIKVAVTADTFPSKPELLVPSALVAEYTSAYAEYFSSISAIG